MTASNAWHLFADWAHFTWVGITNTKQLHSQAQESHFQHGFAVNAQHTLLDNNLSGPHVTERTVTGIY